MNRRDFMRSVVGGVTTLPFLGTHCMRKPLVGKPNIIFILADDLGYGDLSCYGQTHFQTPNIDRLAAEGMKFTDHYSGSTVCAPSRSSLMTGLHTGHTYIRGNKAVQPEGHLPGVLPTSRPRHHPISGPLFRRRVRRGARLAARAHQRRTRRLTRPPSAPRGDTSSLRRETAGIEVRRRAAGFSRHGRSRGTSALRRLRRPGPR